MNRIPSKIGKKDFSTYVKPYLPVQLRGYKPRVSSYKMFNYILHKLHTGCPWNALVLDSKDKSKINVQTVYYHFRSWARRDVFKTIWDNLTILFQSKLNLSAINFDGSHCYAKKGGGAVGYQGRKRAKTTYLLLATDADGVPVACLEVKAGNHNDSHEVTDYLKRILKELRKKSLAFNGAFFNADAGFDVKALRKTLFNNDLIPNIKENKRNRKVPKRGRQRLFSPEVYKKRNNIERTFAWVDKFRTLTIRYERNPKHFFQLNCLAFAMICLKRLS